MATANGSKGFIRCYGMFWDRSEVEWSPGSGNKNHFRLLGRVGKVPPKLQICDFRTYRGIYVLYDDHGARYVGLARGQDIGSAFANTRQTIWIESGSGSRGSGCKTVLASRDQQSFQQPG